MWKLIVMQITISSVITLLRQLSLVIISLSSLCSFRSAKEKRERFLTTHYILNILHFMKTTTELCFHKSDKPFQPVTKAHL